MITFDLTVATLDKVLFQGPVEEAYFPTPKGEIGVLTNHATYLTDTIPGMLRCFDLGGTQFDIPLSRAGLFFIQNNKARLWVC